MERGSSLWDECIAVVGAQADILKKIGVDFSGLVGKGLLEESAGAYDGNDKHRSLVPAGLDIRRDGGGGASDGASALGIAA